MEIKLDSCRICLVHEGFKNIFEKQDNILISHKIVYCASVQISGDDLLPKMICGQCLFYLDIAYAFRMECESTDTKLRNILTKENEQFDENVTENSTEYKSAVESENNQFQNQSLDQSSLNNATNTVKNIGVKQSEETADLEEYSESAQDEGCSEIALQDAKICDTKTFSLDIDILNSLQKNQISYKNKCPQNSIAIKMGEESEQRNVEETGYISEMIKPRDNSNAKVGRHIAKKITGKLPQKLHQNSNVALDDTLQNCGNNLNNKVILKNVNKFEDIMKFEEVLESNMPLVVSEETVITEDSFPSAVDENQEDTADSVCNNQYTNSSEKLKCKIAKKLKISPKLKMILRKGNRRVNVFINHQKDTVRKQKRITKICSNNSEGELVDEKIEEIKNEFKCDICNKQFPFRSHLKRHLNKHTGAKLYSCKFCEQKFVNNYNLNVHMSKHTGDFPLKCDICNKGLPNPSLLKRHMTSHTGEQKFQCRYCSIKFRQSSSLRSHEKMHVNRPSYQCDICFKVFSYTNSLTAHRKLHFGMQRFSCDICLNTFSRKSSLIRHMGEHTKSKRIKCKLCNLSFHSKINYNSHLKTHSKYKCGTCGEGFRYKTNFTEHVKCHRG